MTFPGLLPGASHSGGFPPHAGWWWQRVLLPSVVPLSVGGTVGGPINSFTAATLGSCHTKIEKWVVMVAQDPRVVHDNANTKVLPRHQVMWRNIDLPCFQIQIFGNELYTNNVKPHLRHFFYALEGSDHCLLVTGMASSEFRPLGLGDGGRCTELIYFQPKILLSRYFGAELSLDVLFSGTSYIHICLEHNARFQGIVIE